MTDANQRYVEIIENLSSNESKLTKYIAWIAGISITALTAIGAFTQFFTMANFEERMKQIEDRADTVFGERESDRAFTSLPANANVVEGYAVLDLDRSSSPYIPSYILTINFNLRANVEGSVPGKYVGSVAHFKGDFIRELLNRRGVLEGNLQEWQQGKTFYDTESVILPGNPLSYNMSISLNSKDCKELKSHYEKMKT